MSNLLIVDNKYIFDNDLKLVKIEDFDFFRCNALNNVKALKYKVLFKNCKIVSSSLVLKAFLEVGVVK